MASYYRVSPKYWLSARRRGWNDAQVNLGLYLLTCEHRNLEGLYRLPKPYIAADLNWTARKVDETLAFICESGFASYDDAAEMVLIPKALKHQQPNTERQIIGAVAQLERIPRTSLWDAFRMACQWHCPKLADAIAVRWPSLTDGISHAHAGAPAQPRAGAISSSSSVSSSTSNSSADADAPSVGNAHPGSELNRQLNDVSAVLAQCPRLHVDLIGVENAIAAWPNGDPVQAAHEVVTWATDPAFQMTNAARALGSALSKQQQRQQQRPRTYAPKPDPWSTENILAAGAALAEEQS